jgi:hypothetical protein
VNAQASTKLGGIDYAAPGHTLLALHANEAITFDLATLRKEAGAATNWRFQAMAGYGGSGSAGRAGFHIYVDGALRGRRLGLSHGDAGIPLDVHYRERRVFSRHALTTWRSSTRCAAKARCMAPRCHSARLK